MQKKLSQNLHLSTRKKRHRRRRKLFVMTSADQVKPTTLFRKKRVSYQRRMILQNPKLRITTSVLDVMKLAGPKSGFGVVNANCGGTKSAHLMKEVANLHVTCANKDAVNQNYLSRSYLTAVVSVALSMSNILSLSINCL